MASLRRPSSLGQGCSFTKSGTDFCLASASISDRSLPGSWNTRSPDVFGDEMFSSIAAPCGWSLR